jgi:hypothetical protein
LAILMVCLGRHRAHVVTTRIREQGAGQLYRAVRVGYDLDAEAFVGVMPVLGRAQVQALAGLSAIQLHEPFGVALQLGYAFLVVRQPL